MVRNDKKSPRALAGTRVREVYDTHPAIRDACNRSISEHAATLVPDIEEAMRRRNMHPDWTAESLTFCTQATIQGAFILAKAKHNRAERWSLGGWPARRKPL